MIHIRVTQGVDKGEQIKTRQAVISIGRSLRCDLVLNDNKVSHLHGEFLFVGSRCSYRDLLSRNGSFVRSDGKTYWLGPLKSEREVKTDDEVIVGNTTILLEGVLPEQVRVSERHEDDFMGTMAVDANHLGRPEEQVLAIAEVAQFHEFLDLPSHDATSVKETKAAICDTLIKVLPDAACVAIVDLRPGHSGELTLDRLDVANVVSVSRGNGERPVDPYYSFRILRETYSRRDMVFYGSRTAMPDAPSIQRGTMHSCVCLPLWRGGEIAGFLHAYTIVGQGQPFTRRDAQLLQLLGGVASLLISRAADAEQRTKWCAAAAAGEAVSGLSHDARPILDALGKNMIGVEKDLPQVASSPSWQLVQQDLTFLRRIARDAIRRARTGLGDLHLQDIRLRPLVDDALQMCKRYFLDLAHRHEVTLVNRCHKSHTAMIDREALQQALINCIKNCLTPLREAWTHQHDRFGTIRIVSCDDFEARQQYCLLSVCDDVGGIPQDVLDHLGSPFVSGQDSKGMGLGMYIVLDVVGRMGGQVQIATSTESIGRFPAGSIVSFRLPKTGNACQEAAESTRPRLTVVPDYAHYCARIEEFFSKGEQE
jgi:signal transduction histidine kinase